MKPLIQLFKAAKDADWMQVVLNQGPPCFHLEDGRFCLRAERWDGHKTIGGSVAIHEYVSLENLLRSVAPDGNKCAATTRESMNHPAAQCKFKAVPGYRFCRTHQKTPNDPSSATEATI